VFGPRVYFNFTSSDIFMWDLVCQVLQSNLPITRLFFAMKTCWIDQVSVFRDFNYEMMQDMKREIMMTMSRQGWLINICVALQEFDNGKAREVEMKILHMQKTSVRKYAQIFLKTQLEFVSNCLEFIN